MREEASIWVVRLMEGLSAEQEQQFFVWLGKCRDHKDLLFELAATWDELGIVESVFGKLSVKREQKALSSFKLKSFSVAALMLVCVFIVWQVGSAIYGSISTFYSGDQAQSSKSVYSTATGEQSKVTLSDGSIASLNTNSRIAVHFSNAIRKVELSRGEGMFEVKHDNMRPFVVEAGNITIRAVGTAFNVYRINADHIEILVSKGRVAVSYPNTNLAISGKTRVHNDDMQLTDGELAKIDGPGSEVTKIDKQTIESRLAWTSGMLIFDGQPLEQVIAELSRYTETKFIIRDSSVGRINVSGYFSIGDVNALLFALSNNFNITWDEPEKGLIVLHASSRQEND